MSRHTPGPWTAIVGTNAKGQQMPPRIIRQGKAGIIATLGIPDEGDRNANARLIEVAPLMLEALQRLARAPHGLSDKASLAETIEAHAHAARVIEKAVTP